jgi:putative tricarboxylic transport membrane protein
VNPRAQESPLLISQRETLFWFWREYEPTHQTGRMKKADQVIGIVVVILGIVTILLTRAFPPAAMRGTPGPAFFPRLISWGLIVCGVLLFFGSLKRNDNRQIEFSSESLPKVLGVIVLMGLLPLGLTYLGFLLTCFSSCFVFFAILRVGLFRSVIIALCISFAIYAVFHYGLQVQFPKAVWW